MPPEQEDVVQIEGGEKEHVIIIHYVHICPNCHEELGELEEEECICNEFPPFKLNKCT